jgi:glycosyltransferase involved in cell wall biosynthesis
MRIAIIHTPLNKPAGGERHMLRLTLELQKRGHLVEIFTNRVDYKRCFPEFLSQLKINEIPVGFLYYPTFLQRLISGARMCESLGRLHGMLAIGRAIPEGKFDIINCFQLSSNWAAFIAKRRLGLPIVWQCNEPPFWFFEPTAKFKRSLIFEYPFYKIFDRYTVRFVDKITVSSHWGKELVKKAYNRSSTIIRPGVDMEIFKNMDGKDIRKRYGLQGYFVLSQVSACAAYKRVFDSFYALRELKKKYRIKLILVGNLIKETFKELIKKLGVEEDIIFLEGISDKDLAKVYAASDAFLYTGKQTWGLPVIEAMASSKPVIVSDKAAVCEVIEEGRTGLTYPYGNVEELTRRVEYVINNISMLEEVGKAAYAYVKENLSWERYAFSMERLFKQVLNKQ